MPMMIPEISRGHAAIHGIRVGSLANLAVRYLIGGSSVRFPKSKNPGTRPGFLLPRPDSHFARDPDDTLSAVVASQRLLSLLLTVTDIGCSFLEDLLGLIEPQF